MNEIDVFDCIDYSPTMAGMAVTFLVLGFVLIMVILESVKEYKNRKGPFDEY